MDRNRAAERRNTTVRPIARANGLNGLPALCFSMDRSFRPGFGGTYGARSG